MSPVALEKVECSVQYISQKISKVAFQRFEHQAVHTAPADVFAVGSWDDGVHNAVSVFRAQQRDYLHSFADHSSSRMFSASSLDPHADAPPLHRLASQTVRGDVADLKFLNSHQLLYSTSAGDLGLLSFYEARSEPLERIATWEHLHRFSAQCSCSCTCFATHGNDVATAGEDGRMNLININNAKVLRTIGDCKDQPAINAIEYVGANELITANAFGQLLLHDLRQKGTALSAAATLTPRNQTALTSLSVHPSQLHVVAAGSHNGTVGFWDMRQPKHSVSKIASHDSGPVWEVKFHSVYPDNFFSCSEDGSVCHWDAGRIRECFSGAGGTSVAPSHSNPWLLCEAAASKLQVSSLVGNSLLPLNSFDSCANSLVCGGDAEAIFVLNGLALA